MRRACDGCGSSRPAALALAVGCTGVPGRPTRSTNLFLGGLQTRSEATGTATHLGRTTCATWHCTPLGDQITGGTGTLTAANGDQVFVTYSGTAPFNLATAVPGVTAIPMGGPFTIVGGTGRFAGASGSGTMNATVLFEGLNVQYWPGTWSWTGTISY